MAAAPQRSHSLRIRARLLADARSVLTETGQVPALNELAHRNDVGIGTVYRHFGTARSLLETLAAEPLEALLASTATPLADPAANLHRMMREQVRLQVEQCGLSDVLSAEVSDAPAVAELLARVDERLDAAVMAARQAGAVRIDINGTQLRRLLSGLSSAVKEGETTPRDVAEVYLKIVIAGLAAK